MAAYNTCSVCGSLPEELTVNYGREERYPEAYYKLIGVGATAASYRLCPECKTYFFCVDEPQEYGSGNNASETITRFSAEQSRYLETLLNATEFYNPNAGEAEQVLNSIPRHQLIFALYGLPQRSPKAFEQFIIAIVKELSKQDDVHWWNLVKDDFIGHDRQRAKQVANYFRATAMTSKPHVNKMLAYCAQV